ncbi:MAG: TIGR00180 family glycosyltransferase [Candidatus Omnitrophica bacterium]|nr:TIGR00180 family glycosyltransferase [Candidatus Omnitrophota bacterium]
MLTVLIPTYNRYEELTRLLAYLTSVGRPGRVDVLDSSAHALPEGPLRRALAEEGVVHRRYDPAMPPMEKLADGLAHVTTPYTVVWNDDDFLVPRTLRLGAQFLEAHPDYSLAHGRSATFKPGASRGTMEWVAVYPQRAIAQPTASERLLDHFTRYGAVLNYSVHRTALLRENVRRCCAHSFGYAWGELALGGLDVIQGKAHCLHQLYLLKEIHDGPDAWIRSVRNLDGARETTRATDVIEWFTEASFAGKYAAFRSCLAEALKDAEGIAQERAEAVATQAFWCYALRVLSNKANGGCDAPRPSLTRRTREWLRNVPGARSVWRAVGPRLPGRRDTISLSALLKARSPYHEDFMPMYRAMTERR